MNSELSKIGQNLSDAQNAIVSVQNTIDSLSPMAFEDLEFREWKIAKGPVANTGAVGKTAVMTAVAPGAASALRTLKPSGAYANGYSYVELGANPQLVRFVQEGAFLFPTQADVDACQAIEFDLQQVIGGVVYNWGVQFDYADGRVRVWDRSSGSWLQTGIRIARQKLLTWQTMKLKCSRLDGRIFYDILELNGTEAMRSFSVDGLEAPSLPLPDMLNFGFQMDANAKGQAYNVCVGRMRLKGWIV